MFTPAPTRRAFGLQACVLAALAAGCGGTGDTDAIVISPVPTPPPPTPVPPPPTPAPPAPPPAPAPSSGVPSAATLLSTLENFAQTAARHWSFGGHTVSEPFDVNQGWWDYADTTYEPWLFDRPQAWHLLYGMTGRVDWLQQANSDLGYYESRLDARGIFLNKTGEADTKYSYVHRWSTNAAKRQAAYDATVAGWPDRPNLASGALWTEREVWVALQAAVELRSAGGGHALATRAQAMLDHWDEVCAGGPAPLVSYTQHEGGGPGGTTPTDPVSSPWMSALYFQAAREYGELEPSAQAQVHRQASRYFDWLATPQARGFYPGASVHPEYDGLTFPAYLAGGTLIGDAGPDAAHAEHALDLAGFCAFAVNAKLALGESPDAAFAMYEAMKRTAARVFADWTRSTPSLPRYRLTPPRKFNWWVRGMHEISVNGLG